MRWKWATQFQNSTGRLNRSAVLVFWLLAVLLPGVAFTRTADNFPAEQLNVEDLNLVLATAQAGTVSVSSRSCGQATSGSGFVVGEQLLTNRHVAAGGEAVTVSKQDYFETLGLRYVSANIDLAVVEPAAVLPLTFANSNPEVGSKVWFSGRSQAGTEVVEATVKVISEGLVWGLEGDVLVLEGDSRSGFSGGPVLDGQGNVVGMLQARETTTGLTLAIPVEELSANLSEVLPKKDSGQSISSNLRCKNG